MKRIRKPKPAPKPKPVPKTNLPVLQELALEVYSIVFFYVPRFPIKFNKDFTALVLSKSCLQWFVAAILQTHLLLHGIVSGLVVLRVIIFPDYLKDFGWERLVMLILAFLLFTGTTLAVLTSLRKLGKSPGTDSIRNEFLKFLPLKWIDTLTALFNSSISAEKFPRDLVNIEVVMLHKKGDVTDPINYRGISLINTILKTLTSILLKRLERWVEENKILPEAQAGFRKGRGCVDYVFTLDATREIFRTRCKNRKLHLLFVDFARAFDSINHDKLWNKLNTIGVSPKLIRILQSIYGGATMSVRASNGCTKKYEVAEGVLQGELTSPLLFSLYISDIEDVFKIAEATGIRGINLNHKFSFHVLAYADDMIILTDSPGQLQQKLEILHNYCEKLGLTVNVQKTKILIFHHQHKAILSHTTFLYGRQSVEVVKSFTYLGVTFCTCQAFFVSESQMRSSNKGTY